MNASAQISLSAIKSSGINSKNDLKKLGLSDQDIEGLKSQISNNVVSNSESQEVSGEISNPINNIPVENEKKISSPKQEKPQQSFEVYGQNIFQTGTFKLEENSDRIIPSPFYTLGTGDRVSITIWGSSEFSEEYTLDEFGNISPKLVGRINLKGLSFENAKKIIASRFGKVYNLSSSRIDVTLSFSKVISVNLVGEVVSPGTYNIPSINSAFNVLSFAGGISKNGSVRNIEIKRDGKLVSTLDIYEFLINPKKFTHFTLHDGDFIVVNALNKTVEIDGEVIRKAKFEIKEKESLSDLVNYAGGLTPYANKDAIGLTSIQNSKRIFKTISLEDDHEIQPGDKIEVFRISDLVYGQVTINGAVNLPGKYELKEGEKLVDLITRAKGINRVSYNKLIHVIRTNPENLSKKVFSLNLEDAINNPNGKNNLTLKELDIVKVFSKMDMLLADSVTVYGKVLSPGRYPHFEGLTINDIIVMSNGLLREADSSNVQIERVLFNKSDSTRSYIQINKIDLKNDSKFILQPYDRIHFRTLPEFNFQSSVNISGEVKYPGSYTLNGRDEKLSSLIKRAGGVSTWAFLEGAKLKRNEDSLGLLLMNLEEVLNKNNSKFDYVLKPGDVITVPKTNNIVTISGAIGYKVINKSNNMVNSPYHTGKRAKFYIKKYAGGYDTKAKKRDVYVVASNGEVKETKFLGLIKPKVKAGDKIVVNYKPPKQKKEKSTPIDWNTLIENTTIKVTGVLTLLILANTALGN